MKTTIRAFIAFAFLAFMVLLVFACAHYFSPYWTLHQMKKAVESGDRDRISQYIAWKQVLTYSVHDQSLASLRAAYQLPEFKEDFNERQNIYVEAAWYGMRVAGAHKGRLPYFPDRETLEKLGVMDVVRLMEKPESWKLILAGHLPTLPNSGEHAPEPRNLKRPVDLSIERPYYEVARVTILAEEPGSKPVQLTLMQSGFLSWMVVGIKLA